METYYCGLATPNNDSDGSARFDRWSPKDRNRRVLPFAVRPVEGRLSEHIAGAQPRSRELVKLVESECGAVAVGRTYLLPPLSSGGASLVRPWLRFHTPLIEPDMQISRIRLSDKTSRLFACNALCSV